jgi:hypothetical protein
LIGDWIHARRARVTAIAACAALLILFAATSWTAWLGKCATFDEPLHFMGAWIQTHYDDFRCNPEDPPLWKYYVAAGTNPQDLKLDRSNFLWDLMLARFPAPAVHFIELALYQTPGNDADAMLRHARARMLFLGVVLGAVIAWWAWRLGGPAAAVVATGAFAADPNFLAHSPLVKNDVPITLVFLLLMMTIWLLGQRGTWVRCAAVVLLVAVALTTKFSGILTIPILAIALLCRAILPRPWAFFRWTLSTRLQRLGAGAAILVGAVLVGYLGIWACYGFRFGPTPDANEKFNYHDPILNCAENEMLLRQDPVPMYPPTSQLQQWVDEWKPDATVNLVKWADKKRVLPQAWLFGFLYTYATSLVRRTFLCGEIGVSGWWYYFPLAMVFKTPLATLAGLATAAGFWIWKQKTTTRSGRPKADIWDAGAFLVFPVFYMAIAMRSHLNIGLRHVLPVYPYLFIFLGVMAAAGFRLRPKLTGWIIGIFALGLLVETAAAFPDYIPFFNVAFGGSRGGLALLSDSNMDWGQDLPALAKWQREHPERQLYLAQFSMPDPRYYGIHYIELDGAQVEQEDEQSPAPLPPVFAISAVALQRPYMTPHQQATVYNLFENEKPIAILHGTIYLFDLPTKR